MCPYDSNLIDKSLLTNEDIKYINKYHQEVFDKLSPIIKE